jgi:tetratricopeptide (TPR) repeat protein
LRFLRVLLFLPAFGAPSECQTRVLSPQILSRAKETLAAIYNLDYDRAEALARRLTADLPDHPAGDVLLARTEWARQLSQERGLSIERFAGSDFFQGAPRYRIRVDASAERRFREISEQAIRKAKARIDRDPGDVESRYLLGLAYQHIASYDFSMKRDWWSAFQNGSKTLKYHRELLHAGPDFIDPRLSTAVEYYVAAAVPWYTKWLSVALGYRGDKERGKRELEQVAEKGILAADDALTILALFYSRDGQHTEALKKLAELQRRHPGNYLAHLERAGALLRLGRAAEATAVYREILEKIENARDGYQRLERASVFNRTGVAVRAAGDPAAAAGWFERALADPQRSSRTRTVALLELGKTLDLLGRRAEAVQSYRQALEAEDFADSRREAQQYLARAYSGEPRL